MTEVSLAADRDPLDLGPGGDVKITLDKNESIRAVALMMGIKYHTETIIKDAEYLRVMLEKEREQKFRNEPSDGEPVWHLKPSTVGGVIHCAQEFEAFLRGERSVIKAIDIGGTPVQSS